MDKIICPNCKKEMIDCYELLEHCKGKCNVSCKTCIDGDKSKITDKCVDCSNYKNWKKIDKYGVGILTTRTTIEIMVFTAIAITLSVLAILGIATMVVYGILWIAMMAFGVDI